MFPHPRPPARARGGGYWTKKAISCPTDKYGGFTIYMQHMSRGKWVGHVRGLWRRKDYQSIKRETEVKKMFWKSGGSCTQASTNPLTKMERGICRLFEEISCCTKSLTGENIRISLYTLLAPRSLSPSPSS